MLNKCTIGRTESTYLFAEGVSFTKNGLRIKGEYYSIKGFNMESIGIEVKYSEIEIVLNKLIAIG